MIWRSASWRLDAQARRAAGSGGAGAHMCWLHRAGSTTRRALPRWVSALRPLARGAIVLPNASWRVSTASRGQAHRARLTTTKSRARSTKHWRRDQRVAHTGASGAAPSGRTAKRRPRESSSQMIEVARSFVQTSRRYHMGLWCRRRVAKGTRPGWVRLGAYAPGAVLLVHSSATA